MLKRLRGITHWEGESTYTEFGFLLCHNILADFFRMTAERHANCKSIEDGMLFRRPSTTHYDPRR